LLLNFLEDQWLLLDLEDQLVLAFLEKEVSSGLFGNQGNLKLFLFSGKTKQQP
jgi:hypothetical protein